jgi:subtilisin family serine protease
MRLLPGSSMSKTRGVDTTRRLRCVVFVVCLALITLATGLLWLGIDCGDARAASITDRPLVGVDDSSGRDGLDDGQRVVVKVDPKSPPPNLRMFGLSSAEAIGHEGTYSLQIAPAQKAKLAKTLNTVRRLPGVVWAQESAVRSACLTPNDPLYLPSVGIGQWGLRRIGMPTAWDVETGSPDVTVAVLDTGIDKNLPDFEGRIVSPYSVLDRRSEWPYWRDDIGHGTQVAGVAVAQGNNGLGMAGVAWDVKIMPVKIAKRGDTYDYALAEGIYWAVDHGADIINISFAGSQSTAVEIDAIAYAVKHGVTVVGAAGNSSSTYVAYPAALPGVLAVGATSRTQTNELAWFSCTGTNLDLVAPGTDIWTTTVGADNYIVQNGTSFAAPFVTGVAALLLSAAPQLSMTEVADILMNTADDLGASGWDRRFGWGLLNADGAVAAAKKSAQVTTVTSTPATTVTTVSTPSTTTTTTGSTTTTTTTSTTVPATPRFVDVSAGSNPYFEQIEHLAALGIVRGTSDGLFRPEDDLRRQQFAKMIVLTLGYQPRETDTCPFTDVIRIPGELYPYHYVAVAWRMGITNGTTSGHFSPYRSLTRAQLITMIVRSANLPVPPADYIAPFSNFSNDHFPYARRAAYAGLLDGLVGVGKNYDFLAPASRGEVCALLYKLLQQ